MGGRTMPTECRHGRIIDWGDFGPDDPEHCPDCESRSTIRTSPAVGGGAVTVQWTGHPWATVDHRPLSPTRASCAGCGQTCTPHCGCPCCCEPAYEWCLAEARWWAAAVADAALHSSEWLIAEARECAVEQRRKVAQMRAAWRNVNGFPATDADDVQFPWEAQP